MIFGLFPAASIRVGCAISVGTIISPDKLSVMFRHPPEHLPGNPLR
jgi:hypothetical protein